MSPTLYRTTGSQSWSSPPPRSSSNFQQWATAPISTSALSSTVPPQQQTAPASPLSPLPLLHSPASTTNTPAPPPHTARVPTVPPRQPSRRTRRILQLQWRGVALVSIIIANVIYFAVVFIELDNATAPTAQNV